MATAIFFEVDEALFVAAMREAENDLDKLIDAAALDLARELESAGGAVSARLGANWDIDRSAANSRRVEAPEWWAHFVAHGTQGHGPRSEPMLAFSVDGDGMVFASYVRGQPATDFDTKAIARTRSNLDNILRRLIG